MSRMIPARRIAAHGAPVSLDTLSRAIPTIANAHAYADRSAKFRPVTTLNVLARLESEGFQVYDARSAALKTRLERDGYQKHMIRLRHVHAARAGDYVPELVLINANDGTSSYQIIFGAFRFVCENGIIIGSSFGAASVLHMGDNIASRVIDASYRVISEADRLHAVIDRWRGITLDDVESQSFAADAHKLRFPDPETAPIESRTLLTVRRPDDAASDLWTVFNRVQENITRGGFRGVIRAANGKLRKATVRAINGIDASVNINRRLFDLAENYADNLAA